ncbi:MAG: CbtA family protein [Nocardioidaceae bacterium]
MIRWSRLLRAGALAGAAAGSVATATMLLVTEPVIRRALLVEAARDGAAGHDHSEVLVSRTAQVLVGAATAAVVGVLVGVVFAVVFARARPRLPGGGDHARSLALAALGFATLTLLPAVAVPANPPAVGDPGTVTRRTLLYVLVVLLGLLVVVVTASLDRWLAARGSAGPVRRSADVLVVVVLVALVLWALPSTQDRVPADVPAELLWDFRVASIAQLGAMWLTLGTVFGLLVRSAGHGAGTVSPAVRSSAPGVDRLGSGPASPS